MAAALHPLAAATAGTAVTASQVGATLCKLRATAWHACVPVACFSDQHLPLLPSGSNDFTVCGAASLGAPYWLSLLIPYGTAVPVTCLQTCHTMHACSDSGGSGSGGAASPLWTLPAWMNAPWDLSGWAPWGCVHLFYISVCSPSSILPV